MASLVNVELPDLKALARALERGHVRPPFEHEALLSLGLAHLSEAIDFLRPLDVDAVRTVLAVVIAEREERPVPRLDLVWTGPEAKISPARDTGMVVRELFGEARRDVLICGFTFDHGEEIFRPLHAVMTEHAVETTVFLDVGGSWKKGQERTTAEADDRVTRAVDLFFAENWTFGDPRPALFYDPRTVQPYSVVSLHAKCVVVDRRKTLVTSANFTDRGQTRNIEVGVLIEDVAFATRLHEQWWGLVSAGLVRRPTS